MEFFKNNYHRAFGSGESYYVEIDPPQRKVGSYFEETVKAFEYIHANKVGKFQVLLSGGLDSQYVCEVLLRLGMKFDPIIIELKGKSGESYNSHESKYAYDFCNSRNITPVIYDLDFDEFVESGKIIEIAEISSCSQYQLPATLHVVNQLQDGFIVLGTGEGSVRLVNGTWIVEECQYDQSLLDFYTKFNINGNPAILAFSSEMLLAFLLDPKIVQLGTGKIPGKDGTHSSKASVYNNGSGFNMQEYNFWEVENNLNVGVARMKYHGYEQIASKRHLINHPNIQRFTEFAYKWGGYYRVPYVDVIQRLSIYQ